MVAEAVAVVVRDRLQLVVCDLCILRAPDVVGARRGRSLGAVDLHDRDEGCVSGYCGYAGFGLRRLAAGCFSLVVLRCALHHAGPDQAVACYVARHVWQVLGEVVGLGHAAHLLQWGDSVVDPRLDRLDQVLGSLVHVLGRFDQYPVANDCSRW